MFHTWTIFFFAIKKFIRAVGRDQIYRSKDYSAAEPEPQGAEKFDQSLSWNEVLAPAPGQNKLIY
jgi:hypothetical protein